MKKGKSVELTYRKGSTKPPGGGIQFRTLKRGLKEMWGLIREGAFSQNSMTGINIKAFQFFY